MCVCMCVCVCIYIYIYIYMYINMEYVSLNVWFQLRHSRMCMCGVCVCIYIYIYIHIYIYTYIHIYIEYVQWWTKGTEHCVFFLDHQQYESVTGEDCFATCCCRKHKTLFICGPSALVSRRETVTSTERGLINLNNVEAFYWRKSPQITCLTKEASELSTPFWYRARGTPM